MARSWNRTNPPRVRVGGPPFLERAIQEEDHDQAIFVIAAALLVTTSVIAQNEPSQDTLNAPTALQSTTPEKPPVATVPEAATEAAAIPRRPATTGQAPNVSRKMGGLKSDSPGDQRASPDEQ